MNTQFAYLLTVFIFAGIPLLVEIIFGYRLIRKFLRKTLISIIIALILTPILENAAFYLDAWHFSPEKNMGIVIAGDALETYIFTCFDVTAKSFVFYIWTYYENRGLPIIKTSIKDIWRREFVNRKKNNK